MGIRREHWDVVEIVLGKYFSLVILKVVTGLRSVSRGHSYIYEHAAELH